MTDHAARAVELAEQAMNAAEGVTIRHVSVAAAQVHAILALAEAVERVAAPRYVVRPRWDDDQRASACDCGQTDSPHYAHTGSPPTAWGKSPEHPLSVTERGQERPNGAGDVRAAVEPEAGTGDER